MLSIGLFIHFYTILVLKALNIGLTKISLLHDKKIYSTGNFRNNLVEIKVAEPHAIRFWKKKCNFKIENKTKTTKKTCLPTYKCTQIRLWVLQWKILHNIYPTNIHLFRMKVKENNKCSYCTVYSLWKLYGLGPPLTCFLYWQHTKHSQMQAESIRTILHILPGLTT